MITADELKAATKGTSWVPPENGSAAKERTKTKKPPAGEVSTSKYVLTHGPPPAFPAHALPPVVREYCELAAAACGVPISLVALPLLANAGAVLGRSASLELKRNWREYGGLWVANIAPPGSAKSAVLEYAKKPVEALQRTASNEYSLALNEYNAKLDAWTGRKPAERGAKPIEPSLEVYYTTNATTEAMSEVLATSAGVSVQRDEISGWVKDFNRYAKGGGSDREEALQMWSNADVQVIRKGRPVIAVRNPVQSVIGGIQPDILPQLANDADRRDGFVERFLFTYEDVEIAGWTDAEVSDEVLASIVEVFGKLRPNRYAEPGDWEDRAVRFDPSARRAWVDWVNDNKAATGANNGVAAGVSAKMPTQLARIALILHALSDPEGFADRDVSLETLTGAMEIIDCLRWHGARALDAIGVATVAHDPLRWRITQALRPRGDDWTNTSAVHRALGGHVPGDDIRATLEALLADGTIEHERTNYPTGGRPADLWRITPTDGVPVTGPHGFGVNDQAEATEAALGVQTFEIDVGGVS